MKNRHILYLMFFLFCKNVTGQLVEKEITSLKYKLENNTWVINKILGSNPDIKEYKLIALKNGIKSLTNETIVSFYESKYFNSFNINIEPCLNGFLESGIFGMKYTISKKNIFAFTCKKVSNFDEYINLEFKIVQKKDKIFLQKIN